MRVIFKKQSASGKRYSWAKKITSVDSSKENGYAFDGDFLKQGENNLSIGDIIIEKYPVGSAKNGYNLGVVYKVAEATDDTIFENEKDYWEVTSRENMQILETFVWETEFLSFRDFVSSVLNNNKENELTKYTLEELEAEINRRKA